MDRIFTLFVLVIAYAFRASALNKTLKTLCVGLSLCPAILINTAHANVVLQPPGLHLGDQYRLVFVTSTMRDGVSGNIADYNQFVQHAADNSSLSALQQTWRAIASDFAGTDAYANTFPAGGEPAGVGIPIYRVDAGLVATSVNDLWDGVIALPIGLNEHGEQVNSRVWTGTIVTGQVGDSLGGNYGTYGLSYVMNSRWIDSGISLLRYDDNGVLTGTPIMLPLYAISGVITAVPEPSTIALACFGALGLLFAACRRR